MNRLTDRARNYLKVSKGHKAPTQQQPMFAVLSRKQFHRKDFCITVMSPEICFSQSDTQKGAIIFQPRELPDAHGYPRKV